MIRKVLLAVLILMMGLFAVHLFKRMQARNSDPDAQFFMPTMELANITITKLTREEVNMSMDIVLDNPLPVGFTVDSFTFAMSIAGVEVVRSTYPDPLELNPYDRTTITMPISTKQELLLGTLKKLDAEGKDSVIYGMDIEFTKKIPFIGEKPLSFHIEHKLPLFILPEVEVIDMNVEKVGLNDTRLSLVLQVKNENSGSIAFRDTKVTMRVGDDRVLKAEMDSIITVPGKDKVNINLPLRIDLGEALGTMMKFLLKPGTSYQFELDATIVSDQAATDGTLIHVQRDGVLKELKEMR